MPDNDDTLEIYSDNSDSEEEANFLNLSKRDRDDIIYQSKKRLRHAQPNQLITTSKGKKQLRKNESHYNVAERGKIRRKDSKIPDQVKRDLSALNSIASKGKLTEETIRTVPTKFLIAVYRGIHNNKQWPREDSLKHRQTDEIEQPLYSQAAYSRANSSFFKPFPLLDETQQQKLKKHGIFLRDRMLRLHQSGTVGIQWSKNQEDPYQFSNAAFAFQDLYSKKYSGFVTKLEQVHQRNTITSLEDAILMSIDGKNNPYISCSFLPNHALRYSYGDKPYNDKKDEVLSPSWDSKQKSTRSHVGKVYWALLDPLELKQQDMMDIVTLDEAGEIAISHQIIHENELSIFGYLSEKHIHGTHIAKFPSFDGEYKTIYLKKYGLDEELWSLFKSSLFSDEEELQKRAQKLLTQHLCSYNEVCLIGEACKEAEQQNAYLIYPNGKGGFDFLPPVARRSPRSNEPNMKNANIATNALQEKRRLNKRKKTTSESQQKQFLNDLMNQFDIKCLDKSSFKQTVMSFGIDKRMLEDTLPEGEFGIETRSKDFPADELIEIPDKLVLDRHGKRYQLLQRAARLLNKQFVIHHANYRNHFITIGDAKEAKDIHHIYYLGGDSYLPLIAKPVAIKSEETIDCTPAVKRPRVEDDNEINSGNIPTIRPS